MPLQLRLPGNLNNHFSRVERNLARVPLYSDALITVRFAPKLAASRGKLLSGSESGTPVHAASFLCRRQIVLETELFAKPRALQFIFLHELLHFAWMRAGNPVRAGYASLLAQERQCGARGEMGDSSAIAKQRWRNSQVSKARWKHYVCESFCDTGAALWSQSAGATLAKRWQQARREWFKSAMPTNGWRC